MGEEYEVKFSKEEAASLLTRLLDLTGGALNRTETLALKKLWDKVYPDVEYDSRLAYAIDFHK